MAKALKEAKLNTSWVQPNEPWDAAVADFVAQILDPAPRNRFLESFIPLAEEVARAGSDQLALANPAQADLARGAGYLSGQ